MVDAIHVLKNRPIKMNADANQTEQGKKKKTAWERIKTIRMK